MKKLLIAIVALIITARFASAAPELGKTAPDFTATDITGQEITLSQFKGKLVVLEWTNPECPFVRKYYDKGDMQKLQAKYKAKGVEWLRINSSAQGKQGYQSVEEAAELAKKQKVEASATILDVEGKIGRTYEAKTTPHMFVIGKNGAIAYMGAIDSIRSVDSADIPKAEIYVAQVLDDLLAGRKVSVEPTQPYGCGVKY